MLMLNPMTLNTTSNVAIDPDFEDTLEKIAEEYAQKESETLVYTSPLIPKEQVKNHLKNEFKSSVRIEDQQILLTNAVRCISQEGKRYLSEAEWNLLSKEIARAAEVIAGMDYQEEIPEILYLYLGMTQRGLNAIETISRAKYQEENFSLAADLNALLSILNPEEVIYWLHLGISYQDCGFYERAIKAYSICHLLDPKQIKAWILCAECYLNSHEKEEAKIEYEEAVQIAATLENSEPWKDHFEYLKKSLG
jgi:tetratricopeptide (TPR) repeat protein